MRYPVQVTNYYYGLIACNGDAIWKQCMPDVQELQVSSFDSDPLDENRLSPVSRLIHRYPDRVLLLVSDRCPVYCRFCMRKRAVGNSSSPITSSELEGAIAYIKGDRSIRDVILSGGDPLMLDDRSLEEILLALRSVDHLKIIRIGSRVPVTMPQRITRKLCKLLKRFHPLYINTHFNHPKEITAESSFACSLLADAGIPLGNQTVLLKGVNDSVDVMRSLMSGLLDIRVKPYYLHQMDLVLGTEHFRTSVAKGLEIINGLRGHISGLAIPHYVIDLPGGKGKVALLPDDSWSKSGGDTMTFRNYLGEVVTYCDIRDSLL